MTSRSQKPAVRPPGFVYRETKHGIFRRAGHSVLHCEDVALPKLAEQYGTPLYVYSAEDIRERYNAFDAAFRDVPHTICYSVKANSNLAILRMLARKGCGFDVVSGGELERVLAADRKAAKRVVFSGVGKTREELTAALKAGIMLFNVESESELWALAECAARTAPGCSVGPARESRCLRRNSSLHFYRLAQAQIRRAHSRSANALRQSVGCAISQGARSKRPHRIADHRRRAIR